MKGTENKPHTLKGDMEFLKKFKIDFYHTYISRCPRCDILFISNTNRKYCSKVCQYDQKWRKERDSQ